MNKIFYMTIFKTMLFLLAIIMILVLFADLLVKTSFAIYSLEFFVVLYLSTFFVVSFLSALIYIINKTINYGAIIIVIFAFVLYIPVSKIELITTIQPILSLIIVVLYTLSDHILTKMWKSTINSVEYSDDTHEQLIKDEYKNTLSITKYTIEELKNIPIPVHTFVIEHKYSSFVIPIRHKHICFDMNNINKLLDELKHINYKENNDLSDHQQNTV